MIEICEDVTLEYRDSIPVITVNTDLRCDAVKFKNSLRETIENHPQIVLVVGEENYLYDEFLAISVSGLKNADIQNVKLALVCAPQHQYNMLEVTRLTKIFDVFRNLEDAIVFFKKDGE